MRDEEGRGGALGAVWPATIASASLVAQMVAGKATRDALFLSHFGLGLLPAAMIGAAIFSAASVALASRALARYGPARFVPVTFGLGGALFLCEWWLSVTSERAAAIAVYLHTAVFFAASGSAFWSLVNESFDPRTAKQVVGRIASGGTVGGILGGVLVWRASSHLSVPMMLALLAGMNTFGLWGSLRMAPRGPRRAEAGDREASASGIAVLTGTPYLRDLGLLVLASAVMQALLDWLLSAYATNVYGKGQELLGFFALFNMAVGVLSFLVQTTLTRPILASRGLGGTIKLSPASVAVGVVIALVVPSFAAVIVLRGIEAITRSSLYRSAYELFYTPLPAAKKRRTKTLIDVGVDRVGTALGSAALFGVAALPSDALKTRAVLYGVLAVTAAAWLVASRLQDGYVSALAASLRSGAVELDSDDALDFTTKKTLADTTALLDRDKLLARIEELQRQKEQRSSERDKDAGAAELRESSGKLPIGASQAVSADVSAEIDPGDVELTRASVLRSRDTAKIKRALALPLTPALASFAVPLLANDAVVRDAVRALRKIAPRVTGLLVDRLVDPDVDVRVRRRIPRVLKVCRSQRAADGLLLGLRDPVFDVRVQVGLALAQLADEADVVFDRAAVFALARAELDGGKRSWSASEAGSVDEPSTDERESGRVAVSAASEHVQRGLAHVFTILGLALEREPLAIAYRALRSHDAALRGTALEYLDVVLPADLRELVLPLLGDKPADKPRERGTKELADELLRSGAALARPRKRP